jgi:hypothetical protein
MVRWVRDPPFDGGRDCRLKKPSALQVDAELGEQYRDLSQSCLEKSEFNRSGECEYESVLVPIRKTNSLAVNRPSRLFSTNLALRRQNSRHTRPSFMPLMMRSALHTVEQRMRCRCNIVYRQRTRGSWRGWRKYVLRSWS